MKYGFVKTAVAVPQVSTGDCSYNADSIIALIDDAANKGVEIVLLPELLQLRRPSQTTIFHYRMPQSH